jgi:anti-anti-sigma factor
VREFVLERGDRDGIVLLYLDGQLRLGVVEQTTRRSLSDAIGVIASEGGRRIALDLRGLLLAPDSSGLGELVAAQAALSRADGRLAIVNAPPKLRNLIAMMRLEELLPIYDTEDDAVRALAQSPAA